MYGQLINLLDKQEILKFSRANNGERYVKHFDAYQHLVVMLYAVIKRIHLRGSTICLQSYKRLVQPLCTSLLKII